MSKLNLMIALSCLPAICATNPIVPKIQYAKLPLGFEENRGQANEQVKYLAHGQGFNLYVTSTELLMTARNSTRPVRMRWMNRAPQTKIEALDRLPGSSNYFIGNDPAAWRTNIPSFGRVAWREVYPGIDVIFYGNQRKLEYDLVVAPQADPNRIRIAFDGVDSVSTGANGDVILRSHDGDLQLCKPVVYQMIGGRRSKIEGSYKIEKNNELAFEVASYDRRQPLVIDPVIGYLTYLGGSGDDRGRGIAVDSTGAVYITGSTDSTNFPHNGGAQTALGGSIDAFVTKINPAGTAIVYSTYLGGASGDQGNAIAVDSAGSAYVTGVTVSVGFPTSHPIQAANGGLQDVFVTKLTPNGDGLVYSTYLGGSNADTGYGIAVDTAGNCFVAGFTGGGFPTASPLQGTYGGGSSDAFLAKINAAGSALVYSTYLGGSSDDSAYAVAVDAAGNAYITGATNGNFPTVNAAQPTTGGGTDAFITKVNPAGSALVYSTFLGGSSVDFARAVAVDSAGSAYVTGFTTGNFPVVNALQNTVSGLEDAFVAKLNPQGNAVVFATYLGGSGLDNGYGIAVDSFGNINVVGSTTSTNFPLAGALQTTAAGAFFSKLNPQGNTLTFSTYLGGTTSDTAFAVALDPSANVYITGVTAGSLPVANAVQTTYGGGTFDAFVAQITGTGSTPTLTLSRTKLNFGIAGSLVTSPQSIGISFTGGALASWTATSNQPNITVSPTSGAGSHSILVTATAGASGTVTITAPGTTGSPQTVTVNVATVTETAPFGSFDTPANNTTGIAGAVGVTGWALDSVEVTSVGVWREPVGTEATSSNGLVFIGNATFVAGARPDVEAAYPNLPYNYRAGWGYMLLTNFLPNNNGGTGGPGNGIYKLHAIAVNKAGTSVDLGTHTITVNNAAANKPFGTIDTPDQGGTAAGSQFINFGWALTQNPNCIPTDGSTITVTVDSVTLGHPVYNQFRQDIATAFPGRCNSDGAIGYFIIDTTKLTNGVHTIGWVVYDNVGHGDGIGSRFFTVANAGGVAPPDTGAAPAFLSSRVSVKRGFDANAEPELLSWNANGVYVVNMEELSRIELDLGAVSGNLIVAGESQPLPAGSTLRGGVFYWQPVAGFLGEFPMRFERADGSSMDVMVRIGPKSYRPIAVQ